VLILQHGLTEWRGQPIVIADAFAKAGWATLAIDINFHGGRSFCTDDKQCMGTCNKTTGQCSGGFATTDPTTCTLQPILAAVGNTTIDGCRPDISGNGFVNAQNFFLSRDNQRQFVVDMSQLVRVIQDSANPNGLEAKLKAASLDIDPANLAYLGQSLGAILGTVYLSAAPEPTTAYLSVPGGHLFDEFAAGSFHKIVDDYLASIGVMKDTPQYFQLAQTARWITDPADPFAVGRHLIRDPVTSYLKGAKNPPKVVLQQQAGLDTTIPPQFQSALALEIFGPNGLDNMSHVQSQNLGGTFVSTYWPTAVHASIFEATPSPADHHITDALQVNATTFISTGGATITPALTQ
jgi:hypothetical protein